MSCPDCAYAMELRALLKEAYTHVEYDEGGRLGNRIDAALAKNPASYPDPAHEYMAENVAADTELTVGSDPRDSLRLRWFAETAQLAEDGSDWNDTIMGMVVDRFNLWRKLPPNDALDAMRKAIDTQVVHEDARTTPSSLPIREE